MRFRIVLKAVLAGMCMFGALAQEPVRQTPPAGQAFWDASGRFVGSKQCAACHPAQAKGYSHNSMSRALEPVSDSVFLKGDAHLAWTDGAYSYSISREADKLIYRVTDGRETFKAPLEYAFGQGKAGQTYVYSLNGVFQESRVSYYAEVKGLDITVGARNMKPSNVTEAAGRAMLGHEARDCFGCHTTGARVGATLQLEHFEDGVQCESCHGPGGEHVASIRNGKPARGTIRSLRGMDAQESSEFCGVCHRTWDAVMLMGIHNENNVRFTPYRLANSQCFSVTDARIACTACHNPHGPLVEVDKAYDAKCEACHNKANVALKKRTCPVAKQNCTSCHMPKVEPPEAHHGFADHDIRIVRSKTDYPG